MKSGLTIGKKLALGMTAFLACLGLLSITSLQVISMLGRSLDAAVNSTAKKLELVGGTRDAFQELKSASQRVQNSYAIAELQRQAAGGAKGNCVSCHARARRG